MLARIYRPAKTAMQSGKANTKEWLLEFEPASARTPDRLMGWTLSSDMNGQVRLAFVEGRAHVGGRNLARATGVFKLMRRRQT